MTLAWDLQEQRYQLYGNEYWERVGLLREVKWLENYEMCTRQGKGSLGNGQDLTQRCIAE